MIGGIGLGLGYIAPVSTLVKWFPDRPGMATGLAIMGFGGGALIGAPLGVELMGHFKSATSVGVKEAFLVMGCVYFAFMMFGAFSIRVPALGWRPEGYVPPATPKQLVTHADVSRGPRLEDAAVLAALGRALPERHGRDRHPRPGVADVSGHVRRDRGGRRRLRGPAQPVQHGRPILLVVGVRPDRAARPSTASSSSLGAVLYALVPIAQRYHSVTLFVLLTALIISMYGGGFATIPAYLRDLFGTMHLGAIHGRLITAWSMAAVLGPQLVNYISTYRIEHGVPRAEAYNVTMYLMAGLLLASAWSATCSSRPVDERFHHRDEAASRSRSKRSDPPHDPSRNDDHDSHREEILAPPDHSLLDDRACPSGLGSRPERGQIAAAVPDSLRQGSGTSRA